MASVDGSGIDIDASTIHIVYMATKTISLTLEAYERLNQARRHSDESLSDVVMRALWDEESVTAGDHLRLLRDRGPSYSAEELEWLENAKEFDLPPAYHWRKH
jgi:predicted CopG family antitoxin